MSASQATVSRQKKVLEKDIEEEQTGINVYKTDFNPKDDEIIWVLEAKKSRKEKEFKKCYWFQCMDISFLSLDFHSIEISFLYILLFHYSQCSLFSFYRLGKEVCFSI